MRCVPLIRQSQKSFLQKYFIILYILCQDFFALIFLTFLLSSDKIIKKQSSSKRLVFMLKRVIRVHGASSNAFEKSLELMKVCGIEYIQFKKHLEAMA
jgi:hypothetical protein